MRKKNNIDTPKGLVHWDVIKVEGQTAALVNDTILLDVYCPSSSGCDIQYKDATTKNKIMKRIFFLLITFILLNQVTAIAQEISVSSTFSHTSFNKFQNNIGYEIGYSQSINSKNRLGFAFTHAFNLVWFNSSKLCFEK